MRVLSGIQPSGALHIANYYAMMKPMIRYQEHEELYAFIVNYHALTSVFNAHTLKKGTIDAALDFLALGLDPDKALFWVQSDVPEVTELTWILSNVIPVGLLERCHSYKDKIAKGLTPNHGLFAYPVLMAADILLYQSERIPVGQDQKQHVEVARDIAIRFNNTYGETFVLPEPEIDPNLAVIPGVDGQKMSKSYGNTIDIFCTKEELRKSVMRIVTDSTPVEAPKDPDRCTLFAIYSLFLDEEGQKELAAHYRAGGLQYSKVKKNLVDTIWAYFKAHRRKREALANNLNHVYDILESGARKAREKARPTIEIVRERVGIRYRER